MATVNDKLQFSVSSSTGSTSLSGYDTESGNTETVFDESFPANSVNNSITLALTAANLQSVFLLSDKGCTLRTNNTNTADVQTISITGAPTGGSFPIGFGNAVAIAAYNTNAASLQTTLQAMTSIGNSNINCSGGPLPTNGIICTFAGTLNTGLQAVFSTNSAGLTGGTNAAVSVAHTTSGLPSNTIVLTAGIPLVWGTSQGYGANPFTANVNGAFVSCTPATRLQMKILSL
jgi:hypothetical protein